jgi:hypothetical protein
MRAAPAIVVALRSDQFAVATVGRISTVGRPPAWSQTRTASRRLVGVGPGWRARAPALQAAPSARPTIVRDRRSFGGEDRSGAWNGARRGGVDRRAAANVDGDAPPRPRTDLRRTAARRRSAGALARRTRPTSSRTVSERRTAAPGRRRVAAHGGFGGDGRSGSAARVAPMSASRGLVGVGPGWRARAPALQAAPSARPTIVRGRGSFGGVERCSAGGGMSTRPAKSRNSSPTRRAT